MAGSMKDIKLRIKKRKESTIAITKAIWNWVASSQLRRAKERVEYAAPL